MARISVRIRPISSGEAGRFYSDIIADRVELYVPSGDVGENIAGMVDVGDMPQNGGKIVFINLAAVFALEMHRTPSATTTPTDA